MRLLISRLNLRSIGIKIFIFECRKLDILYVFVKYVINIKINCFIFYIYDWIIMFILKYMLSWMYKNLLNNI